MNKPCCKKFEAKMRDVFQKLCCNRPIPDSAWRYKCFDCMGELSKEEKNNMLADQIEELLLPLCL